MATDQARTTHVTVTPEGYLATGNFFVDQRVKSFIIKRTERRFRQEVDTWAAANTGQLRTRLAIRVEIARELETLFASLGSWAYADADEIFPEDLPQG